MEPKPQWLTNTTFDPAGFISTWPLVEDTTLSPESDDWDSLSPEEKTDALKEIILPRLEELESRLEALESRQPPPWMRRGARPPMR